MWDKLTERSRRIHYKAQEEAHRYGHPSVGTEHILLGILDEPDCMAARVLSTLAGGLERVRVDTIASMPPGAAGPHAHLGFSRSARRAMELSQEEAALESTEHIASGHLLLGIMRCQEGGAAGVLSNCGIQPNAVRNEIQAEARNMSLGSEDGGVAEQATVKSLPPLVRASIGRSWDHMSLRTRAAVEAAMDCAASLGDTIVMPEHLLMGILQDDESAAARALRQFDLSIASLRGQVTSLLPSHGDARVVDRSLEFRLTTRDAISQAELAARADGDGQITTDRLLIGIMAYPDSPAAALLMQCGVTQVAIRKVSEDLHRERSGRPTIDAADLRHLSVRQLIVRSRMKGRNLLRVSDLSPQDIEVVFAIAEKFKARKHRTGPSGDTSNLLAGKILALVFQKPSLRTRVTFEIAMTQLGGHAIHLGPDEIGVGEREAPADVARNLERWVHGIVARTFKHEMIEALVQHASVPVINGLSDLEHPCQALADLFTMRERFGVLKGLTLAYVGDSNNVARSLMELAARTGVNMRVASPKGYHFDQAFLDEMKTLGALNGAVIEAMVDPHAAVIDADAVYTDVWASMGQEAEAAIRKEEFAGYQLNMELMSHAKPTAIVLHCQPAHRGEEISSEAVDSPNSAVFDEAENRLHVQQALLALVM